MSLCYWSLLHVPVAYVKVMQMAASYKLPLSLNCGMHWNGMYTVILLPANGSFC